jgi:hypothetical protein
MGSATAPAAPKIARPTMPIEILEDRWDGFVSSPDGTSSPKFLRLCRALNVAVAAVSRYEDEDEAPLEDELLDMLHERIVRRVAEGGHLTMRDLGEGAA